MFQGMVEFPVLLTLAYDPTADEVWPMFKAPRKAQIISAYVTVANDIAAHADNHIAISLLNGGAAGTAVDVIAAAVGGAAVAWTGLTAKAFTVAAPELADGDMVTVKYDESGTGTFTQITVQLNLRYGDQ